MVNKIALSFLLALFLTSCGDMYEEDCDPTPSNCRKSEPQEIEVRFEFTQSEKYGHPILMTYSSKNIEEGHLVQTDTVKLSSFGLLLPPGEYAFLARYIVGKDTLELLEQSNTSSSSESYCGGVSCYSVDKDELDFRLHDVPPGHGK